MKPYKIYICKNDYIYIYIILFIYNIDIYIIIFIFPSNPLVFIYLYYTQWEVLYKFFIRTAARATVSVESDGTLAVEVSALARAANGVGVAPVSPGEARVLLGFSS